MKYCIQQPGGMVPTPALHKHCTQYKTKALNLVLCPAVPQPSTYSPPGKTPHCTLPKPDITDPSITCFLLPQAYTLCQCIWELFAQ